MNAVPRWADTEQHLTNVFSEVRWRKFIEITSGQQPWPQLVRAAEMFENPGDALDAGAGGGRDTAYLLQHGWRVTAVDSSPSAAAALTRIHQGSELQVVVSTIQDFTPARYDLVNAQFSLPFIPPPHFASTVRRLRDSVRPGGVMTATFFGPHDEWNVSGTELSFSTRAEVEQLFSGWEIVELAEDDEDGHTADGTAKHWHVLHLTVRRPSA
jgi:tellurite methyltransferase